MAKTATKSKSVTIDVTGVYYRDLNAKLRQLVADGVEKITLKNVCGQRYIGTDLNKPVEIEVFGTPGNDLGAFMDGPRVIVHGNAQDCTGNTMNSGEIVIHGHAGDIFGMGARGGKMFVKEDVGYRAGIHMKEYKEKKPVIVIGGTAQDFFGEYMAGGIVILLGLNLRKGETHKQNFIGTGMHGGVIYMRGEVDKYQLGKEVGVKDLDENDFKVLSQYVGEFANYFSMDAEKILKNKFYKLFPLYLRPYGRMYTA